MTEKKRPSSIDLVSLDAYEVKPEEYDELPEITEADFARGKWYLNGQEITEEDAKQVFGLKKHKISITLDQDIIAWFKAQAKGRGYQTLINAALRDVMQKKSLEETLRKIIREEIHAS